jgi:hypothetical protein
MAGPMRTSLATLVFLVALAIPATAVADAPVVTTEHVDYAMTIPGDQNPCGFDLVFTGVGDVTITTFSDGRQFTQGILTHTISSQWQTLSSIGPATVHADLATGVMTDTGMEFSFHVAGEGVVLAQAGNFTFLPDGTVIEHGLDRFSPELCEVLAP